MNYTLHIVVYNVIAVLLLVAMFTTLYHLSYGTQSQLKQIEMVVRRTESGVQNIQIRLSHLERVLLNYDHGVPETKTDKKEK